MKYFFALIAIITIHSAMAQDNNYTNPLKKYKNPPLTKYLPKFEDLRSKPGNFLALASVPSAKLLSILPNGTRVFALPEDHMPCLVPDMNQFRMPNAGNATQLYKYHSPGSIPNPMAPRG